MKIICSIGPNIKNESDLDEFVEAGMDSMRLNFSHADYPLSASRIKYMRSKYPAIEIIQDLQGNKLRVSNYFRGQIKVKTGDAVTFCSEEYFKKLKSFKGKEIFVPVALDMDFGALLSADKLLMKDATMEFEIISKNKEVIKTKVVRGGVIRGEKGINAPGMDRSSSKLTKKDKKDIKFGINNGVDVICLSYASSKKIIQELIEYIEYILKENPTCRMPKLWAKIECRDGVKNISEIIDVVDGIMLGRGDLSSEVDIFDIPQIEDKIITKMKDMKQELIIATFILESMRLSSIPSIAEVESIAHFVKSKVDGIMLAGEVGVGRNPIKVISTAKSLVERYDGSKS